jgi:hypothetical protein
MAVESAGAVDPRVSDFKKITISFVFYSMAVLGIFLLAQRAVAASGSFSEQSFRGTFDFDDDIALIDFNVPTLTEVQLLSLGYAGGTNLAGEVIPAGGFDTTFNLFDSAGGLVAIDDDGRVVLDPTNTDPVTGAIYDSYLSIDLAAGDYTLALTQYDNFANGANLSDGFARDGQPDFTFVDGFGTNPYFNDVSGDGRTGNWAVDVRVVPEPTGVVLMVFGSAAAMLGDRRQRSSVANF